jgi:outer membrane protein OmpA-like peptidoglycan-associated protein
MTDVTNQEPQTPIEPIKLVGPAGDNERPTRWLWLVAALLVLFALGMGVRSAFSSDDEPQATGGPTTEFVRQDAGTLPGVTTPPTTAAPVENTTPTTEAAPEPEQVLGSQPLRYADGKIFLTGTVRDQETADTFAALAAEVVGEENVVETYVLDPNATEAFDGRVVIDDPVLFPSGSAVLQGTDWPALEVGLAALEASPSAQIVITGHTDDVGDSGTNTVLSIRRARAVAEFLVESGADVDRIETNGAGEDEPVADNATPEGRAENRRIELEITGLG